jgi:hypothetical protein
LEEVCKGRTTGNPAHPPITAKAGMSRDNSWDLVGNIMTGFVLCKGYTPWGDAAAFMLGELVATAEGPVFCWKGPAVISGLWLRIAVVVVVEQQQPTEPACRAGVKTTLADVMRRRRFSTLEKRRLLPPRLPAQQSAAAAAARQ